jgi:glyoxylase-like metal-dependent hydrolase (beta-lactamase superfamily II)
MSLFRRASAPAIGLTIVLAIGMPAHGQTQSSGLDLSGDWTNTGNQADTNAFSNIADYTGIPLSEAGRMYSLTWSPSRMTGRQQQCAGYDPTRLLHGGGNYRFWENRDPFTQKLISLGMYGQITEGTRTIWMDGRPHPPAYAPHTFLGFSTGKYEGSVLTVYTTHIKRNWIRTNGVAFSSEATLVEHFIRHGDRITYVTVLTDPVYLSEPMLYSTDMRRLPRQPDAWLYACDDGEQVIGRPVDQVPNYPFGKNPYLREYADKVKLPLLGALGGRDSTYPEFEARLKDPAAADAAAMKEIVPVANEPRSASRAVDPTPHDGEIHVLHVQGNVYLLIGDGANIALQTGDQGALLVDTGAGKLADKVIAAVKALIGNKPIQFIVNTSARPDHTGGNVKVRAAGADPSVLGSFFSGQFSDAGQGATIIAHQNVQNLMEEMGAPSAGIPSDTWLTGRRRKFYNDEAVEIFWEPNATSDGDSIVHFRRSDVIATGDIFNTTQYPVIDVKHGGSIFGEIDALDKILDITVYKHLGEGGTMIVPGHGRISDEYELSEYRDMLAITRDRVQALINSGATLEQAKASRVTVEYDGLFGANSGPWTTEDFIGAVYTSLKQGRPKPPRN